MSSIVQDVQELLIILESSVLQLSCTSALPDAVSCRRSCWHLKGSKAIMYGSYDHSGSLGRC